MKQCVGDYRYKGFLIGFSEYCQEWFIEPFFLFSNDSTDECINASNDFRDSLGGFKTIAQAKKYIKENEKTLKDNFVSFYSNKSQE